MQVIEPNWISLLWFAVFATIGTVALLIVAGMFPLRTGARSGTSTLLVFSNAVLLAALLTGTGLVVLVGVQMLALAALAKLAEPSWVNLS